MTKKNLIFEQLLIQKLKFGDTDAFSDIFSGYYKDLVFFAYSFTREQHSAEDMVQDTFIRLWEDREQINVTVSLKSILLKTIQNKCIDWHRHRKIVGNHSSYIIHHAPVYEYNTDSYVVRSEMEGMIEKALAQLPEKVREAYELHRFEGLKYKEIAAKQDVSIRTVEVRISQALEFLRMRLIDFF